MNKVELIGRLANDVELKKTSSTNKSVTTFRLAVNRPFKKDGQPDADFIQCTAWGNTAELLKKYVSKGNRIGVCGRIQTRKYDKNGHTHYVTEVVIDEIEFLENKAKTSNDESIDDIQPDEDDFIYVDDGDLPF